MEDIVRHIHLHPEHTSHPKSHDGHECIYDAEYFREHLLPIQRDREESEHARQEVNDIVECIDFENPEEWIGKETKSSDDEEHHAHGGDNCFLHICDVKNQTIHATY